MRGRGLFLLVFVDGARVFGDLGMFLVVFVNTTRVFGGCGMFFLWYLWMAREYLVVMVCFWWYLWITSTSRSPTAYLQRTNSDMKTVNGTRMATSGA